MPAPAARLLLLLCCRRRLARLQLLLLLLLLLLRGALPGAGRNAAEEPPRQVNGRLGGSISFPLKLPPNKTVARIEWFFQARSGPEFLVAELRGGKLEWRNASNNLGQWLEMAGETTLRIRALEEEDNGVLRAQVLFATDEVHKQTFRLSVFEPVPDPQLRHQLVSRTAEGCNVTLRCLASEKGPFNISWKGGNQLSVLEEHSGWYRLSAEGTELHLSWRPDSLDSTVTCLLSNPADQKNTSLDLLSICPSEGHPQKMWLLLPAVLLPSLAAGLLFYLWKKRSPKGALALAMLEKAGSSPELQYAEVQKRRSPPEGVEDQDPDPLAPCLAEIPTVATPPTVYAVLQPPPPTT